MEFLEVDGSHGEGGGQTLRTALTFSVITRRPVRVSKIRAGREVPGLKKQHLSALQALGQVFDCELSGAAEGSQEVTLVPGRARVGSLEVDMKTAASITLVLQAVVPAVAVSRSSLSLDLRGGTDVPWSPTFDYFAIVAREGYRAMGIDFSAEVHRRGYYPKGGGTATAVIRPCESVRPLRLVETPVRAPADVVSRCAALPRHVAERQLNAVTSVLTSRGVEVGEARLAEESADSPGSSVLVSSTGPGHFIGSDSIGARGKPSEEVGAEAATRMADTVATGACVDANLSDMLAPLLSLASGPSELRVPHVSAHLETSLYVAELFTSSRHSVRADGRSWVVSIIPP